MRYILAGVDEAGRGPLAGPVVAAVVVLPAGEVIDGLNDSKKLSAALRDKLDVQIRARAAGFGIGIAGVDEIDRLNILQATFLAMQRAIDQLAQFPEFLLVDGRDFPRFFKNGKLLNGKAVIKGDARSAVIAAASILAKVHRDKLMENLAAKYPQYGFEKHKGYGTAEHREKILQFGPCPAHRSKFLRRLLATKQTEAGLGL